MKCLVTTALVIMAAGVAIAFAQTEPQRPQPIAPPASGGYYGGDYPIYSHSSTAAEGRLRGMGDLVRSAGQANLDNSAAAINYSVARSSEIENHNQWTNTYFQMRETNRRARAAERGPRPTMADAVRYAQAGKPKLLSPSELDPITGKISWPLFLQTEKYSSQRSILEQVFANRASNAAVSPEDYVQTRKTVDTMLAELKKEIRDIPAEQYLIARRFLKSLSYAATQPVG